MRIVSLVLYCLLVLACWAQPYRGSVRTFTIRDGLPGNSISGVEQSPDGLMWFATWNGLCCYDGYRFTTFRSDSWGGAEALSSNRISMIKPDSKENVWVRTYDSGLYLLDTRQCRFVNVGQLVAQKYGKTIHPRNFYALPNGHTWITGEQGDVSLRIDDRYPTDVERMEVVDLQQHPHTGHYIRKVEADADGREWLTTDLGILQYGSWQLTRREAAADGTAALDSALVYRLATLGIAAANYDKHFVDQQGNVWLTSPKGLTLVSMPDNMMRQLPLVSGQLTRSLLWRRDGTVWAGSHDGYVGVYAADGRQVGWLSPQGRVTTQPVRFADRIYAMLEDSKGNTWIGSKGQGLYVVTPQGSVSHYQPDASNPYALSHAYVYAIDEDAQGNLWVGTYGGGLNLVSRQADGTVRFLHSGNSPKGFPQEPFNRVRRITHDEHGTVLLSCTEGLVTFSNRDANRKFYYTQHEQQDTTSLRTNDVLQTLVTRAGRVYVVTSGGAIQQLVSGDLLHDGLQFQSQQVLNRGSGSVLSMIEDGQGCLWIVRETEVCKYSPVTGQLERFVPNTLSADIELTEALPAIDRQGRLWVAAMEGLLTFDSKLLQKSSYSPHILFTSVLFQGERETRPLLNRQTLTIAKDQRNLTLSFAALDYGDHYLMEYAYRMDGDEAWNYIGSTPRISFSQLPPGQHTLEVRSTNSDGVWVSNAATLYLDVTPLWWERTWVQLLALLLLIIGISRAVLAYKQHRQTTREREQRLENILRQYRELQHAVAEQQQTAAADADVPPPVAHDYHLEQPKIVDADEEMMGRLMAFIEQHIADEDLKIDDMANAVGMGRTVFYNKIRELVGVSPVDFLRQLRMQRATQLIAQSTMNISQVAYAVGFSDPKYFSRCFKKETGLTPREYREQHTKGGES